MPSPVKRIFISYKRKSSEQFARAVKESLNGLAYHAFLDIDDIGMGEFGSQIYRAISDCSHFVALISVGSLQCLDADGDWMAREFDEARRLGKEILIVFEDALNVDKEKGTCRKAIDVLSYQGCRVYWNQWKVSMLKVQELLEGVKPEAVSLDRLNSDSIDTQFAVTSPAFSPRLQDDYAKVDSHGYLKPVEYRIQTPEHCFREVEGHSLAWASDSGSRIFNFGDVGIPMIPGAVATPCEFQTIDTRSGELAWVRIREPFFVMPKPMTECLWKRLCKEGDEPCVQGDKFQTEVQFSEIVDRINLFQGKPSDGSFRLPFEYEWECAVRGSGAAALAVPPPYDGQHLVEYGEIWEWCLDQSSESDACEERQRVAICRGGSRTPTLRKPMKMAFSRIRRNTSERSPDLGFRLVFAKHSIPPLLVHPPA